MRAIIGRELRSYYNGAVGYVFAAFILLFVGIYTMAINLKGYVANFEFSLSQMSFVYLIAIPIITMRMIAEEKRQKTDQLLYSLPMGVTRIVLGKYFASLIVLAVPVAIICFYPLILTLYGTVNLFSAYGSILAFFLLGASLISVGMFISSVTESQVVAAVLSFIAMLINFFISQLANLVSASTMSSFIAMTIFVVVLAVIIKLLVKSGIFAVVFALVCEISLIVSFITSRSSFEGLFPAIMKGISMFDRFYSFIGGVFDITSIVYFIMTSFVFVFLTVQSLEKRRWN
ncbi:MAG: ABC transporter permease subunit [Eubacteriales bacterium]